MSHKHKDESEINIYEEVSKHPLSNIDKPRKSNEDFIADLIEASNLVNKFLAITAASVPALVLEKLHQGILLGHAVRMYKLYDSFLLLISENRSEMALLAMRALTETSIILKYLIQNINDDIGQKFIKSSLAYEKKLLELIQNKTQSRNTLPFEKNIIESIKKTFAKTKYKTEDIIFKKDKSWHEDLFTIAEKVGLSDAYETMYRAGSHAEHGSWHHLMHYNLNETENRYEPELNNIEPNFLLINATSLMCLIVAHDYLIHINPEEKIFPKKIKELIKWIKELNTKRDNFLGLN